MTRFAMFFADHAGFGIEMVSWEYKLTGWHCNVV